MQRSTDRILTTHVGSLPRPDDLTAMLVAKDDGEPYDGATLEAQIKTAVRETVRQQLACGLDVINDGEQSKRSWSTYAKERLAGHEDREPQRPETRRSFGITGRDSREFEGYYRAGRGGATGAGQRQGITGAPRRNVTCTGPLRYIGQAQLQRDIANFKAALEGQAYADAVLTAVAPGTISHWMRNDYYPDDESLLSAIADAMNQEYRAIVDAGFSLQVDEPSLADGWQMYPDMTVAEYREHSELRVAALNRALAGVPPHMARIHVCWGSVKGPHKHDIDLADIIDLICKVNVEGLSIEAANPRHAHEWRVFERFKLPPDKVLIPGVAGHCSDFIEHPRLIADRLLDYARLVGREKVIAGTDCGLGPRVGHPKIAWAKFAAIAEGARIASQELWR